MTTFTYLAAPSSAVPGRPRRAASGDALDRLLDGLVEQGGFSLRQLQRDFVRHSTEVRGLLDAGYLQTGPEARLELTPLALRAAEERMLLELFRATAARGEGFDGRHGRAGEGGGPEAGEEARPLRPGEPFEHLDVSATLRRALERGRPPRLRPDDVVVRPGPAHRRCSTVLLLDLSGSMAQHGKFALARRAALALRALVRRYYPEDELIVAGFASRAERIPGRALLEVTPRSVGLFDPARREHRLGANSGEVPEHFTNIQAGLRLARQLLRRCCGHAARQIVLVTDGEPTAHLEGDELVLAYPPTEAAARHTLAEAVRCAREGVALSIFGLVGEFGPPGLRSFVERLARAGKGKAVCCPPFRLGEGLLAEFVRRTRSGPR